jgi:hypothetical protein
MARGPSDGGPEGSPEPAGYGRPPPKHRIRDSEVRNPWGRRGKPKPPRDFLDELIEIRVDGQPCKITRSEALDHFLFGRASKGDVRAIRLLEERARLRRQGASGSSGDDALSSEDLAAFERYVRREAGRIDREGDR